MVSGTFKCMSKFDAPSPTRSLERNQKLQSSFVILCKTILPKLTSSPRLPNCHHAKPAPITHMYPHDLTSSPQRRIPKPIEHPNTQAIQSIKFLKFTLDLCSETIPPASQGRQPPMLPAPRTYLRVIGGSVVEIWCNTA